MAHGSSADSREILCGFFVVSSNPVLWSHYKNGRGGFLKKRLSSAFGSLSWYRCPVSQKCRRQSIKRYPAVWWCSGTGNPECHRLLGPGVGVEGKRKRKALPPPCSLGSFSVCASLASVGYSIFGMGKDFYHHRNSIHDFFRTAYRERREKYGRIKRKYSAIFE